MWDTYHTRYIQFDLKTIIELITVMRVVVYLYIVLKLIKPLTNCCLLLLLFFFNEMFFFTFDFTFYINVMIFSRVLHSYIISSTRRNQLIFKESTDHPLEALFLHSGDGAAPRYKRSSRRFRANQRTIRVSRR